MEKIVDVPESEDFWHFWVGLWIQAEWFQSRIFDLRFGRQSDPKQQVVDLQAELKTPVTITHPGINIPVDYWKGLGERCCYAPCFCACRIYPDAMRRVAASNFFCKFPRQMFFTR